MTWPEFVARVEAEARIDNSATVLDIDVSVPAHCQEFDLCVAAGQEKITLSHRVMVTNSGVNRVMGDLIVWKGRNIYSAPLRRGYGRDIPPCEHRVATPNETKGLEIVRWGALKRIVQQHRDYSPDMPVFLIDIDACEADHIVVSSVPNDERFPTKHGLAITGRQPAKDPNAWMADALATRLDAQGRQER